MACMNTRMLRVAIVSALLDAKYGGPSSVLRSHVEGLSNFARLTVIGGGDADNLAQASLGFQIAPKVFPFGNPRRWFYCRGLDSELRLAAKDVDVIHAHMVWDHPVFSAWRVARSYELPLVITPHGSLNADGRNSGLIKTAYMRIVLGRILRYASAIHALNRQEENSLRTLGVRCPIHVIPNGLPRAQFEKRYDRCPALNKWPEIRGKRLALYLGRLWSGKGLDILPKAWAQICENSNSRDWLLVLAGPDYRGYRRTLVQHFERLGISDRVLVTGAVYGDMKHALLAAASFFVLPSHGEGFSVSVLEAMAARLPVVVTSACNFPEVSEYDAGVVVPSTVAGVKSGLQKLLECSEHERELMGNAGWRLGLQRYTLESVSSALLSMYHSCLK